jgi:hypothetical protein
MKRTPALTPVPGNWYHDRVIFSPAARTMPGAGEGEAMPRPYNGAA